MPYKDPKKYRDCARRATRKYRAAHPDRVRASLQNSKLKAAYGFSTQEYDAMVLRRRGRCDICKEIPSGKGRAGKLHVDHCHSTNVVRGLLCNKCNTAIGLLHESLLLLDSAKEYLCGG